MTSSHEHEPIRGLPEVLPAGEEILWQGSPAWRRLAVTAFHVRKVGLYFGVLALWHLAAGLADGTPATVIAAGIGGLAAASLLAIIILGFLAWLAAGATVYTITTRRVVMRFGVALPLSVNVPFRVIASAGLRLDRDGTGDIPLALSGSGHIAYLALWPHARPWRVTRPEPMLRALTDAQQVASILADALHASLARPLPRLAERPSLSPDRHDMPAATAA